ncbi:cellulose binding domain-containing protein [Nonomuraea ferruginea]
MAAETIRFFGLDSGGGPTSTPTITPTVSGPCQVGYTMNTWNTGFTTAVSITNRGASPVTAWSLAFTLPAGQTITGAWNTTITPSSGQVTATNAPYNGTIAPNATVTFGFQATHTGNTAKPSAFTLNGAACAVQ